MNTKKVGILRGGNVNTEHSLHLGKKLSTLLAGSVTVVDLLVDTEGELYMGGKPLIPVMVDRFVDCIVDVTFNIPTTLVATFRGLGIHTMAPSDVETALFTNRALMQKYLTPYEVNFPYAVTTHIPTGHSIPAVVSAIHKTLPPPWRVWDGAKWHSTKTNTELHSMLVDAPRDTDLYIQERPLGHRVEVLVLRNFRNQDLYISIAVTTTGKLVPLTLYYKEKIHNELTKLMHLFVHTDSVLASYIVKEGKNPILSSLDRVHLIDDHVVVSAIREQSGITDEEVRKWYVK
ncbi:MAG: hypothetical protein ACR2IQ_01685 [Minisyncoccia bacterium]